MELFLFGVLVAVVTVGLAITGLLISRKYTAFEVRRQNNYVADPLLQVIGTLYAVLLGLLVVQAMQTFEEARQNVESEAVALADTFRLSAGLPPKVKSALQNGCLDYAAAVVNDEWDDMQELETCDRAWIAIDKMWWDVISFEPTTVREKYIYPELLSAAKELNDFRRSRLVTSRSRVSPILWVVLITGAASTIIFTYTFGVESLKAQMFMTALVAITLSLNLYLWSIYSNPFYGLLRVPSEAFVMDLEHFQFYFDNPDDQRWHMRGKGGAPPNKMILEREDLEISPESEIVEEEIIDLDQEPEAVEKEDSTQPEADEPETEEPETEESEVQSEAPKSKG